jgi:uncharacterized protein (TIGR02996 family)
MSDTEASLLAAIVESPEDDLVRLVYADWLSEQPDEAARARAEFIRLEIEMAGMMPRKDMAPNEWEHPNFRTLEARAGKLCDAHAADWFGNLDELAEEWHTHRGFVDHIAVSARRFITHGEEIFRLAPTIRNVFLDRMGRNMPAVAKCPALGHVRELVFFETPVRAREMEALAESPYLGNLRHLEMPYTDTQIGPRGARALARAETLTSLEHLDLGNQAIYDEGATALFRAKRFANLRYLALDNNGVSDEVATLLADADHLTRLTHLDLGNNHLTAIGTSLADSAISPGLEMLDLSNNPLENIGALLLAMSVFAFRSLTTLKLHTCRLEDDGCAALLGSPAFVGLNSLSLGGNRPGQRAFEALAAEGHPALEELELSGSNLGPEAARVLGQVGSLPVLRDLSMNRNPFTPAGIRHLLDGGLLRSVSRLSLGKCQVGDKGVIAIARSPVLKHLRVLHLEDNGITDRGAEALIQSPHLAALQVLWVQDNSLSEKTKVALRERFGAQTWV